MRERINSPCLLVKGNTTLVIPLLTSELVMDGINRVMKHDPALAERIDLYPHYITTTGRVLDRFDAWTVALNANQVPDEPRKFRELDPLDLWPRRMA